MALSSPLDILNRLYPKARVTSTRRDPNSALGRANPHSYHNIGQAFDVAPIPGVGFNDYVSNLKSNGVNVVEALDEASHPKPWTTGPNWHIAYGDGQVAAPKRKMSLASIAQPDLNAQQPVAIGDSPMQPQATSLASLAGNMPQGNIPEKKHSPFNAGNIMGVLGDALMAYGGMQPQFGPNLAHQQDEERQMSFDREKWNAMLQQRHQEAMAKANEPPQWLSDAQIFDALPDPQKHMVTAYRDIVNPVVEDVQNSDGSVVRRVFPRQITPKPGQVEDGHVFLGGDPADPKNWRVQ